jgi:threonine aldolase
VETNILIFRVDPALASAAEFCALLKEKGVLVLPIGGQLVRAVTHLDIDMNQVRRATAIIQKAGEQLLKNADSGKARSARAVKDSSR